MADPRNLTGLIAKPAETSDLKPYENTVLGLLRKRRDLLGETDKLRKALSANMEDIRALDRILRALGHTGDLKRMTPAGTRQVVFHRVELRRFLLDQLRTADNPSTAASWPSAPCARKAKTPATAPCAMPWSSG
jgi:hypothetical protein